MNDNQQPAKASTIIVYREVPSAGIFMVRRSARSSFMPNALVFPGGRLEPQDQSSEWDDLSDLTEALASQKLYLLADEPARALMIAAVRETFEESGILIANALAADQNTPEHLTSMRNALNNGAMSFMEVIKTLNTQVRLEALCFMSRWITPKVERKRFDAFFFLAKVSGALLNACADGNETEQGRWVSPTEVLAGHREKRVQLAPPTLRALETLSKHEMSEWTTLARSHSEPICPQFVANESFPTLVLPGDPLYKPPGTIPNRFVREQTYWSSNGLGF